jgi:hypothetical protein
MCFTVSFQPIEPVVLVRRIGVDISDRGFALASDGGEHGPVHQIRRVLDGADAVGAGPRAQFELAVWIDGAPEGWLDDGVELVPRQVRELLDGVWSTWR